MALTLPYTFISGTLAKSSEVNGQFDAVKNYINLNAILKDASVAFTGVPSLSGGGAVDPSSDNQLARKAYVDRGPKMTSQLFAPTAVRTTTSATYVNWPAGEAFSVSHTKLQASTEILVLFMGSAWEDSAGTFSEYAIRVDSGADTSLASFHYNVADAHFSVHGFVRLTGLSVGAHTYNLRAKTSGGTLKVDDHDHLRLLIAEVN